jgi:hypothetical protein
MNRQIDVSQRKKGNMKTKKNSKKLAFNRQTIRSLSADEMSHVAGGQLMQPTRTARGSFVICGGFTAPEPTAPLRQTAPAAP